MDCEKIRVRDPAEQIRGWARSICQIRCIVNACALPAGDWRGGVRRGACYIGEKLSFVQSFLALCWVFGVTAARTGRVGGHDFQNMEVDHRGPKLQGLRGGKKE